MIQTHEATAVELALAVKRLRARMRAESAAAEGWTLSQLSTLSRIVEQGPLTASALAQSEHVRPQSIAEMVTTLKADGLVRTTADPTDGRKVLLLATDEGRAVVEAVKTSRRAWLAQAIDHVVAPEELAILGQAIEILNRVADCDLDSAEPKSWRG
jgi:DNA-binding MarR family transcriptional regulator